MNLQAFARLSLPLLAACLLLARSHAHAEALGAHAVPTAAAPITVGSFAAAANLILIAIDSRSEIPIAAARASHALDLAVPTPLGK